MRKTNITGDKYIIAILRSKASYGKMLREVILVKPNENQDKPIFKVTGSYNDKCHYN